MLKYLLSDEFSLCFLVIEFELALFALFLDCFLQLLVLFIYLIILFLEVGLP
jgi:hypothetical protein